MTEGAYTRTAVPWNKGKKMTPEYCDRISKTMKARGIHPKVRFVASGEDHPLWKGDRVSYSGLHYWVYRKLGVPSWCEHCNRTEGRFEWANKSREYKRETVDWISLCYSCHDKYDGVKEKQWKTRRA